MLKPLTPTGISLLACDGTFTRGIPFKQTILLAVTYDGQNELCILAFACLEAENADNWVYFKECLHLDFPGYDVWMSDADKGITSNAFGQLQDLSQSLGADFVISRCARHDKRKDEFVAQTFLQRGYM